MNLKHAVVFIFMLVGALLSVAHADGWFYQTSLSSNQAI